jgi:hypothetical protein
MVKKILFAAMALLLTVSMTACKEKTPPNTVAEFEGENSRFAVVNETLDWNAAKKACEEAGGHLATITSQAEQDEIVALLASLDDENKRNSYFLGGVDLDKTGEFTWVTGESFDYFYWKMNEPKPDRTENYLAIFAKTYDGNSGTTEPGRWNDCMVDGTGHSNAGDPGFFSPEQTGYIIEWDND